MKKTFNEEKYGNYTSDTKSVYKQKIKHFLEKKGIINGNLLDIGCNDGLFSKSLNGTFNHYGIDISQQATDKAIKNGINALSIDLNNNTLPYNENFFDVIIMSEVLEHLFDTDNVLLDVKKVLKKGGVFCITVPNIAKHINRINILFGKKLVDTDYHCRKDSAGHIRIYYTNLLEEQLIFNGFKILYKSSSFYPYPIGNKILDYILYKLGDFFPNLGDHAVIICTK